MSFPDDFVWGSAASALQIEGAILEDGKGLSIWDVFCQKEGSIWRGHTNEITCDHYHRYKDDITLMKQIGLKAYRTSISWPRVIPNGQGKANEKGLAFYDRLIDELLAAGITPYVDLFHWNYPYELHCRGGWLNGDSSDWFAEYTKLVIDRFSDRVTNWITFNEPQCFIGRGYQEGAHAPGEQYEMTDVLRVGHNVLLSHGKAVQAIRAGTRQPCQVGYVAVGVLKTPNTDSQDDIDVACESTFSITDINKRYDEWNNTWWIDPVLLGEYPADGLELFGKAAPKVAPGDMETISVPIDFLGLNIYNGREIRRGEDGQPQDAPRPVGFPISLFEWPITPEALYWGPKFFHERYKKPIYITENGITNVDFVCMDGRVHDYQRIDFLNRYLLELDRAVNEGFDVRGYFLWSIMDNFEFAQGFKQRFGIIHIDFETQKRTLKDSAYWYKKVIATEGQSLKDYQKLFVPDYNDSK